ncbi:MAG: CPBP family intramembrane metalloprotease [Planctomycetes bacterium]|nr:CPBP family intramembrane metalloprotease [Planctomycetota bacterium]
MSGPAPAEETTARGWRDLLACLPLLVAYELAVTSAGAGHRNSSDLLLSFPLSPLGATGVWIARAGLLLALVIVAIGRVHRSGQALLAGWIAIARESLCSAIVIGPLLLFALRLVPEEARELGLSGSADLAMPRLSRVGLIAGGAVFEELVFRVGVFGLVYLLARRALVFLSSERWADELALIAAVLGSSGAFAAFHLAACNGWLGAGGESFAPSLFAWRAAAGAALAVLWHWRGFAVAAWTHALFNTALLLGAGPGVLL